MKDHCKKIMLTGVVVIATILLVNGCNTVEGMGEDVEATGDAIDDAAD